MSERKTEKKPHATVSTDKRRVKELPRDLNERVRFTLDLSRKQHRFLKKLAFEEEVNASAVVRALLTQLEEDEALAEAVKARL